MNNNHLHPGLNKLIHHQSHLDKIEKGEHVGPIHLSVFPNNTCQLKCEYCCFSKTERTSEELTLDDFKAAITVFKKYGLKAVEFSLKEDEIIYINHNDEFKVMTIKDFVLNYEKYKDSYSWSLKDEKIKGKITNVYEHNSKEDLLKITLINGKTITTTESHSIFFFDDDKIISKKMSDANIGDLVVLSNSSLDIVNNDFYRISLLQYDNTRNDRPDELVVDENISRLMGYFTAEGSYLYCREKIHGLSFTFNSYDKESKYIDDVVNIFQTKFNYNPSVYRYFNKTIISVTKKWIGELFKYFDLGELSRKKRVPNIIFNLNNTCKIEYLKGLYAGDGNFRNTLDHRGDIYHRNSLHLKTSSDLLMKTVSLLLDIMKIEHTVTSSKNNKRVIEDRELEPSNYYMVNVSNYNSLKDLEIIINHMGKELLYMESRFSKRGSKLKKVIVNKDAYALPIKKIEVIKNTKEKVYDISVENTNRFESSFRILCHNSGGGDPLLWSQFDEAVLFSYKENLKISLITNGLAIKDKDKEILNKFDWIRISIQSARYAERLVLKNIPSDVRTTMSYVVKDYYNIEELLKINNYAKENNAIVRVTPIRPCSETWQDIVKKEVAQYSSLVFFSKEYGIPKGCYMFWIRAALNWKGEVLPCPSKELSFEDAGRIPDYFPVCNINNLENWILNNKSHDLNYKCTYCNCGKDTNDYVHDLLEKVEDVDFV